MPLIIAFQMVDITIKSIFIQVDSMCNLWFGLLITHLRKPEDRVQYE